MGNKIKYCCNHGGYGQTEKDIKKLRRKQKLSRLLYNYEKSLDQEQARDYHYMI